MSTKLGRFWVVETMRCMLLATHGWAWSGHSLPCMHAGDHLYRMNYQDFVLKHRKTGADITVAALPSDEKKATAFGLMKIDGTGRVCVV